MFIFSQPTADSFSAETDRNSFLTCTYKLADWATTVGRNPTTAPEDLLKAHVTYKNMKRWAKAARDQAKGDVVPVVRVEKAMDELDAAVHSALEAKDLLRPLTAMLFAGAAFSDAGAPVASTGGANATASAKAATENKIAASTMILFESRISETMRAHGSMGRLEVASASSRS